METLRSACIHVPFGHAVFIKKHLRTSSVIFDQVSMYMCSLVSVFCSRLFSVKQLTFEIYIFCVNILFTVLFRVLKIKINLVKLTFWTAISAHQVMGMSLTKVWVIYMCLMGYFIRKLRIWDRFSEKYIQTNIRVTYNDFMIYKQVALT